MDTLYKLPVHDATVLRKYAYIMWCIEKTLKIKRFLIEEIDTKKKLNGKILDPFCSKYVSNFFLHKKITCPIKYSQTFITQIVKDKINSNVNVYKELSYTSIYNYYGFDDVNLDSFTMSKTKILTVQDKIAINRYINFYLNTLSMCLESIKNTENYNSLETYIKNVSMPQSSL